MKSKQKNTPKKKASGKKQSTTPAMSPSNPPDPTPEIDNDALTRAVAKFASAQKSPEARLQDKIDADIARLRKQSLQ